MPEDVYKFSDDGKTLLGFKEGIDLNQYASKCDTMQIPANITSIGEEAFYKNSASIIPLFIKNLTFAEGSQCSTIGSYAFALSPLTSVSFPSSLEMIREYAFWDCYSLTKANWSNYNNLSSIGMYAFFACPLSTPLDLSKYINLTSIDAFAFFECKSHSITFPGSLQIIGDSAFEFCRSIEEIIWNNLNSAPIIGVESFKYIPNTGHVKSTGNYTSSELLSLLKEKGGLLSSWEVAKD